ncbi:hypothetical protein [Acaryochloris sp. IP29b_bin.148]|uniref:hypothetical protein n=1 Tax=Acaryochloris sp. IP29b_bin.148 TaxID=2969218 RepID=UPI002604EECA|nr:hypothetical protein [Acaryochloris sp. IP29b_bin.148]
MTLIQVWGCLLIFVICPLLGGLPVAEYLTRLFPPSQGRGYRLFGVNVHWRVWLRGGIEASKGVLSVLLARYYFPQDPTWWIIALIALVFGQFWIRKSKPFLAVAAGGLAYSWQVTFLLLLMGGISLTLLREKQLGRLGLLVLLPMVVGLVSQQSSQAMAAMGLSFLLAWGDAQQSQASVPEEGREERALRTQPQADDAHLFGLFQRDRNIRTLDQPLNADQCGQSAAVLSQLKALGYPVPPGWVLPPGDDAEPLIRLLSPTPEQPLMVRSNIVGQTHESENIALSTEPIIQITSRRSLVQVIAACRTAYSSTPSSAQRREFGVAVLIQIQVKGQYGGIAWSQDVKAQDPTTVLITGGAGPTPSEALTQLSAVQIRVPQRLSKHSDVALTHAQIPLPLVHQIATMAREIDAHYQGIPQKIEWSYDGTTLWLLAAHPV